MFILCVWVVVTITFFDKLPMVQKPVFKILQLLLGTHQQNLAVRDARVFSILSYWLSLKINNAVNLYFILVLRISCTWKTLHFSCTFSCYPATEYIKVHLESMAKFMLVPILVYSFLTKGKATKRKNDIVIRHTLEG